MPRLGYVIRFSVSEHCTLFGSAFLLVIFSHLWPFFSPVHGKQKRRLEQQQQKEREKHKPVISLSALGNEREEIRNQTHTLITVYSLGLRCAV